MTRWLDFTDRLPTPVWALVVMASCWAILLPVAVVMYVLIGELVEVTR